MSTTWSAYSGVSGPVRWSHRLRIGPNSMSTDRAAVFDVVDRAVAHFGRLDVVVNNAGALYAGMVEALAAEAAAFGVKVTIVQPGGYWTDLYTRSTATTPDPTYDALRDELAKQWAAGSVDSEPRLAAEAVMKLVASDDPPLRLLLGSMVYDLAFDISRQRMATWAGWEQVSRAAEKAVPNPHGA